jgi:hypothetical protein
LLSGMHKSIPNRKRKSGQAWIFLFPSFNGVAIKILGRIKARRRA